jgi:hypothetical protein
MAAATEPMHTSRVIELASGFLASLSGHIFDILTVSKPVSPDAALNLAKVVSKLSPLLGNLIEFNTIEFLNKKQEFGPYGKWRRQDPGFPDTVFEGKISPTPGFEIKAWFPLATEITGRFKDSQNRFAENNIYVCMPAWLPEHLIYGRPYLLDVAVVSGMSVAQARDEHYYNPPAYLVVEPEDTTARAVNLQQTNTSGYVWQGEPKQFEEAAKIVERWGKDGNRYRPTREYQKHVRFLMNKYSYRLDTNYAKMDRIEHDGIEAFKTKVCNTVVNGMTVKEWSRLFSSIKPSVEQKLKVATPQLWAQREAKVRAALEEHLQIKEDDPAKLLA